jgi:hypothetical protein
VVEDAGFLEIIEGKANDSCVGNFFGGLGSKFLAGVDLFPEVLQWLLWIPLAAEVFEVQF